MKVTTIHPRMLQEYQQECARLGVSEAERDFHYQQAQQWHEQNATLWAVVIKPWVLVQEV